MEMVRNNSDTIQRGITLQQEVFIADLIACPTCFGHHYAHRQELKSINVIVNCLPAGTLRQARKLES